MPMVVSPGVRMGAPGAVGLVHGVTVAAGVAAEGGPGPRLLRATTVKATVAVPRTVRVSGLVASGSTTAPFCRSWYPEIASPPVSVGGRQVTVTDCVTPSYP